jgi:hypothetical protein
LALLISSCPQETGAQTNAFASSSNQMPVLVPFEFRQGHIMVPARVNGSEPLSFMLDTGYSMTMIHPDLAEKLQLRRTGRRVTIVGIAGEEDANIFEGAIFDIAGAGYAPRRVASLPSEGNRRRRRDGILGAGLFRRFVVQIDPRAKTLQLQEPKDFQYSGQGEILPLKFRKDTPIIEASIHVPEKPAATGQFEIDIGCSSALCLGHDFVETHRLNEAAPESRSTVRQGVGGDANIREGHVPQLKLGRFTVHKPAANFFLEGSPVDHDLAGHIGLEAVRQFRIIFDYSRRQMILESFTNAPDGGKTKN